MLMIMVVGVMVAEVVAYIVVVIAVVVLVCSLYKTKHHGPSKKDDSSQKRTRERWCK